ncbi:hypothetical protein [Pyrobaculum calidifontis]|nr:hypothetical protein [Pyrobaculum calidifontis]
MWRIRGLSTVASFAIFLTAFAVIVLSLFYFYNFLMSTTQKGVAAVYSAVTVDQETTFNASTAGGQLKCWLGGSGIYYVVVDGEGRLVYEGTEPRCPPGPGEYVYKAVRRDGGIYLAKVHVGYATLSPRVNAAFLYVDDLYKEAAVVLYVNIYNPSDGYAVFTSFKAELYGYGNSQYIECSKKNTEEPVVVPPGGSASLNLGYFVCSVTKDDYFYSAGAPPIPIYARVEAYYNGILIASADTFVATVVQKPLKWGSFNYTGSACVVGGASEPLYYFVVRGGSVLDSGRATGGSVACPPGVVGNYTYRVVDGGGYIVTVDVVVGKVRVWAEADRTVAYVNSTHNSTIFNLYLRFTNPNPGYTPLNYTYFLDYDRRLLQCRQIGVEGLEEGAWRPLTLAPGETRAVWVATFNCTVTNAFWSYNSTTVAVRVTASYKGVVLYDGVVGRPGFLPANWVVLKVVAGRSAESPGKSVFAVAQGPGLVRFIAVRPPVAAPYCPPFYLTPNSTIFPLLAVSGLSLRLKFMPGWWEDYVVGRLSGPSPAWLVKTGEGGSPGYYEIWLGPNLQLKPTQSSGSPTPLQAPVRWATRSNTAYWVTANATASSCSQAVANFTAEPMSRLAQWTFSCGTSQVVDQFNYCQQRSLTWGWDTGLAPPGVSYDQWVRATGSVTTSGGTLQITADGSSTIAYGVSALIWDISSLAISTDTTIQVQHRLAYGDNSVDEITYIQLEVVKPDGSKVYVYYVKRICDAQTSLQDRNAELWDVINRQKVCDYRMRTGSCTSSPPASHVVKDLGPVPSPCGSISGSLYSFFSANFNLRNDLGIDGVVTKVAFVVGDSGRQDGAATGRFDNLNMAGWSCSLPPAVRVVKSSASAVYVTRAASPTSPPSLATEAVPSGGVVYAVAQYWLPQPIPVLGTSISVWGLYVRNTGDTQNNVAYVSVGVDTDGDGAVDREYIYYRSDGTATTVSAFISPGTVVCQGTCQNTTQYVFRSLGTMTNVSKYQWSISLSGPGAVLAVAMAAVDGGGSGGFKVYWDDLAVTYSACTPPAGWSGRGYAWASYNYLLVTAGGVAYTPVVQGALTYVANFTGVGKYVALTLTLGEAFGLYLRGSSAGCVYGYYSPSSQWVELRPLAALGDVIVRDSSGNVLARFGCAAPPNAQFIGFKAGPGEYLVVRTVEAWG